MNVLSMCVIVTVLTKVQVSHCVWCLYSAATPIAALPSTQLSSKGQCSVPKCPASWNIVSTFERSKKGVEGGGDQNTR